METTIYCFICALGAFVLVAACMLTTLIVGAVLRAALCLLPYLVAIGLSFVLWGCGETPQGPDENAFRSVVGDERQATLAQATLTEFRTRLSVDASRIDLTFVTTSQEQADACHGYAACTKPEVNGYSIATYWPDPWVWEHPELLAHELCHVHYFQTGEQGDPTHSHTECFDPQTGVSGQVARAITDSYESNLPAAD